jgi:hypothetical protein
MNSALVVQLADSEVTSFLLVLRIYILRVIHKKGCHRRGFNKKNSQSFSNAIQLYEMYIIIG